ncbi:MAG: type I-E CRISPR-associated protein Cse2/CasB [Burkholderiales bacterium]
MSTQFNKDPYLGKVLLEWWEGLDGDRASRAILRRASSVMAVALTSPYQRLYRRLNISDWAEHRKDRLAAVVGLLAHVKQNDENTVAKGMSLRDEGGDRPRVSELRFRRLLESPDLDALFVGLRRVLPLMGHRVNVLALANDIVHWGDAVKKRWAYDFEWPEKPRN